LDSCFHFADALEGLDVREAVYLRPDKNGNPILHFVAKYDNASVFEWGRERMSGSSTLKQSAILNRESDFSGEQVRPIDFDRQWHFVRRLSFLMKARAIEMNRSMEVRHF
jgi:hypothetical protein